MNRRPVIVICGLIIAIGLLLAWWLNGSPAKKLVETSSSALPVSPAPARIAAQADPQESQKPGGPYQPSDPRWTDVRARDKIDRAWEWKMPINFFGRVVDEKERGVSAAKIQAQWSDLSSDGASAEETSSDAEGYFAILGKEGRGITIRVSKEGYYTPKHQQNSFDYAAFWEANYYEPDSAHPVTFHLRRKTGSEGLVAGETQPSLPANGSPIKVDLLHGGQVSANGQIEIIAVTNTEKYPPRVFDWQASITVPDGGLIEHDLEFPFEAPEEGYAPKVEFNMPAGIPDWKRTIEKSYFIRFGKTPTYGRIHVRFNGASQKTFLTYTVNPSGSRNLEIKTDDQFTTP